MPSGPPVAVSFQFQTPDTVCFTWDPPLPKHRNGRIISYHIQFYKKSDHTSEVTRNISTTRVVFTNLEENTDYVFHVRANNSKGFGPFSEKVTIHTNKDMGRAPTFVKAVATSDSSVEVWWDPVPNRNVLGYTIFYTTTAVEDLEMWKTKAVGLTESVDLLNLERYATYAIAVAAKYKTSLGKLSEKVRNISSILKQFNNSIAYYFF